MNSTIYIFGKLSSVYSQYPEDHTKNIFKFMYDNSKSKTQIAIHRDNNVIYYCYIRKIGINNFIGLCVLLNDRIITITDKLFLLFESVFEKMLTNGYLIYFNDKGKITNDSGPLYLKQDAINLITESLKAGFNNMENISKRLPCVDYAIKKDTILEFTIKDDKQKILKSSYSNGYTFIYKDNDFNTAKFKDYQSVISKMRETNEEIKKQCQELKYKNLMLQNKQRNFSWIIVLGIMVAFLTEIVYFKIIDPSEVTHYETKDFVYYGPINNKKPNGIGVAIYPSNDPDGRKYYIGNFINGKRQDKAAILFYKDGDYYYGTMSDDKWSKGILYMNSDNSHFKGQFKDNKPYSGTWYDHKKAYYMVEGEKSHYKGKLSQSKTIK